ncbi:MAG: cytochrome c biogenesis protein CcsA [Planctomycetota bacterium]|nr:cytochrome c biogenesis protein CcsA [Planctomycetota bacterium]
MMPHTSILCFLACYVVAFGLELTRFRGKSAVSRLISLGFTGAGLLAHTWYLLNRSHETSLPPLLSSTHDWMQVAAWLLALIYLVLAVLQNEMALGVFVLPVVLVLVASTYGLNHAPNNEIYAMQARRSWGLLHAALLVFGVVAAAGGLLSAVMYLLQHRRLKTRHAQPGGFQMPSLPRLAQANRWAFLLSFVLLTLGYASGLMLAIAAPDDEASVSLMEPVVLISGGVWTLMAGVVGWLLVHRGPVGRQVAWLTIVGLGCLLLTLFGLQLATGNIHSGTRSAAHAAQPEVRR